MKPILLIKTGGTIPDVAAIFGDFERWFATGLGLSWSDGAGQGSGEANEMRQVDVHDGQQLPDAGDCLGVVITGSAAMVSHRETWSEETARWLVTAMDAELPILGVCYGHQLLAHALGGEVGPNPHGRQMGTRMVELGPAAGSDALLCALPGAFHAQATHVESVLSLPEGAVRLASIPQDPNYAVRFNPRTWGIQFHPEFSDEVMAAYITSRSELVRGEGLDPEHMIREVRQTPLAYGLIERFYKLAGQIAATTT